jgi:hypothetical protein
MCSSQLGRPSMANHESIKTLLQHRGQARRANTSRSTLFIVREISCACFERIVISELLLRPQSAKRNPNLNRERMRLRARRSSRDGRRSCPKTCWRTGVFRFSRSASTRGDLVTYGSHDLILHYEEEVNADFTVVIREAAYRIEACLRATSTRVDNQNCKINIIPTNSQIANSNYSEIVCVRWR